MLRTLELLKTQKEIEKADIESEISRLIQKQHQLINLHQDINERLQLFTTSFETMLKDIQVEVDKINTAIQLSNMTPEG